jgi:hypothetical protein
MDRRWGGNFNTTFVYTHTPFKGTLASTLSDVEGLSPLPLPPSSSLTFVARLASASGGTRAAAALWVLHSVVIVAAVLGGRPLSSWALRVFETFIALQPLLLAASSRSMALALRALPGLQARVARRGGDADGIFSVHLGRFLPRVVRWLPVALLWLPACVSSIAALAMLADPSLRDGSSGGGAFAREALALALAVRALGAPLLVLLSLVRLLRFSVGEFWGRVLPGAACARAGVWLLSALHAGGGGGGEPPPSPDAARRELFGEGDKGGLLHDAMTVGAAAMPATSALAVATAALVVMNGAAAANASAPGDAVDHLTHALLLAAGGLGGVSVVMLLANAWLDPLRRWLRREPPLALLRSARGEGGWAAGDAAGGGGGGGDVVALELQAAGLHEAYWTLLNREGRLLQLNLLGVQVDQKMLVRAFSAWALGGALSLMWTALPRAVASASR